jgi:CRP-like cAMP-binding protein
LLVGEQAFIVHVGDSRIYLLRDEVLEQVTEDHTVYNELIRRKKLSREQVEALVQKNAITRAVGVYEHAEPESLVLDVLAGDRFLLCSDGLSGYFEENLETLGTHLSEPDGDKAARALIDAANDQGGKDNITAVIVTVGDTSARDERRARRLQLKRDLLARMPLFRPLTDREILRVLQVTDVASFKNGPQVIKEGDRGEELFIVLSGTARIVQGDSEIARLAQGDHFGEMALVRSQPRSASVYSEGDSELMVIRRGEFFEILRKEHQLAVKLLWQFLGVLAERLAETSRELGQAREELAAEDITAELFEDEEEDSRKTLVRPPGQPPPKASGPS